METRTIDQLLAEIAALQQQVAETNPSAKPKDPHAIQPGDGENSDLPEKQKLFPALAESVEGFVYLCDADYRLLYQNRQCCLRTGGPAVGQMCYRAIHRRQSPCPFCVREEVRQGRTVRFEILHPEDRRWYLSINTPVRVGGTASMLVVVTDIDAHKKAQATLPVSERQRSGSDRFGRPAATERQNFGRIVGKSAAMQMVYQQILSAAATDATAIIYGEPGTGKELVANAIHDMSLRREKKFVPVHCGAIPENLVESEFFGYKKGAFSGADADKPGYIDYADGGTLFLDEIGEIRLDMQIKLLRMIEGTGYTPVGSNQVKSSNARIIGATNRDLRERIAKGLFREDFYYRIHILPIHLPPLRERKDDLPLLIDHFMRLFGGKHKAPALTTKMVDALTAYDWPGNVRELQNVLIRYCSLQMLELGHAPLSTSPAGSAPIRYKSDADKTLGALVSEFEKEMIAQALTQHRWHRSKVAVQLGIDRKTLFAKMKKHRLG
jgi:transcriptional regulator with PAS, ATPase and Fis domain